ncbi:MAG TPA: hypothetical protein PLI16_01895 [Bacteroidales bacterium]|nr:hypothetical protein [Bacteroidales bacterium]HNZ43474.1 hypothetical protein [Bacteroidales bacterium]HOH83342.1 hypothetical protein [Bacteroidales bacterium]HPB25386.1 hypothetical protein [Bacteroidales bacterium]HPI29354.1 hypothetical protein [Bacteroidales bacterium]
MNKTSTLNEILLYCYGESGEMAEYAIENLLESDFGLNENFKILNDTRLEIENSMVNPPDSLISKVIAYSEALTILNVSEPDLKTMIRN